MQQLLLGQLVMFAGIAAIFPVVPLYVQHRGGTAVDIVIFVAGPMVANTLVQVPAGHLVDRIGRKPMLIFSRLMYAATSFALFADVGPLWVLGALRCLQGASGGAYVPALRAAIADVTPEDNRGSVYAQLQAVEMVGFLIGPVVGGAVALWRDSGIFLCSGVSVLLGIATLWRFEETGTPSSTAFTKAPKMWWRKRGVLVPAIGLATTGAMFSMYDVVWPQYLTVRGYNTLIIGISDSLYAVPILLLAGVAGRLSDGGHRRSLVAGSYALVALCSSTFPGLRTLPLILSVGCVESIAYVVIEPSLFATISESTPAEIRGRAMGFGGLFQFGGSALGAAVLGALYAINGALPFRGGALACLLAGLTCAVALPRTRAATAPSTTPTTPTTATPSPLLELEVRE